MNPPHEFPEWEQLYREKDVESMPWFNPDLDPDLAQALSQLDLSGGFGLDLGTGPGTQAIALAERGFRVTATDLSETAIAKAKAIAQAKELEINFRQDDVLNSHLHDEFDFVFDRGCFHVLPPERRGDYVQMVKGLLKPGGYLFLKCFSYLETREEGPYRFRPEEIQQIFGQSFKVYSIAQTVYQGTLETFPQALFCTLEKQHR